MAARVGFESMEIAILDNDGTVVETHEINAAEGGTISASISGIGAQTNTTYASNVPFYVVSQGTGTVEAEVEIADLPYDVLTKVAGLETNADGLIIGGAKNRPPYVALIFKSHNKEGKAQYFSILKAKGSYDSFEMNTQEDGGPELATDSITFTAVARGDQNVYVFGNEDNYAELKEFAFPATTPVDPEEDPEQQG